jgi:hypothetical protein
MRRHLGHNLDEVQVYKTVTLSGSVRMRGVPDLVMWNLKNIGFAPEVIPLGPRVRGFKWDLGLTQITVSPVRRMEWEVLAYIHPEPLHVCQADAARDARTAIDHVKSALEGIDVTYTTNSPLYWASVHFHVDTCGFPWGKETAKRIINHTRFKITVPDALTPGAGVRIGDVFERYDKTAQILALPAAAYVEKDWIAHGYKPEDGEVGRSEFRLGRERIRRWALPFPGLWPRCLDEIRVVRKPKARKGEPVPERGDWPDDPLWALYRELEFPNPFGDASTCPPNRPFLRDRRIDEETRRLLRTVGRLAALHDLEDDGPAAAGMLVDDLLTAPGAADVIHDAGARMRRLLGPREEDEGDPPAAVPAA